MKKLFISIKDQRDWQEDVDESDLRRAVCFATYLAMAISPGGGKFEWRDVGNVSTYGLDNTDTDGPLAFDDVDERVMLTQANFFVYVTGYNFHSANRDHHMERLQDRIIGILEAEKFKDTPARESEGK